MSDERFKLAYEKGNEAIFEDLAHPYPRRMTNKEVERKLNEQQSIIDEQKIAIDEMITDYKNLEKENEQLKKGKARLTERLRECGMRLDRFNCR